MRSVVFGPDDDNDGEDGEVLTNDKPTVPKDDTFSIPGLV